MKTNPLRVYRRLPGFCKTWIHYYRLYAANDHLLQVTFTGASETYKRFFFRDIQAISIQKSRFFAIMNWVLGVPVVIFGVIGASVVLSMPIKGGGEIIPWLVALSLLALPLLLNNLRGPSCITRIYTAVHAERLWSLSRLHPACKTLDQIKPLIEAAQGQVAAEDLQHAPAVAPMSPAPPVITALAGAPGAGAAVTHYDGQRHLLLCWLLLADLPGTILSLFWHPSWIEAGSVVLFGVTLLLAIMAIVKQRHSDLPRRLQRIPWWTIWSGAFFLALSLGYGIYLAASGRGALATDIRANPLSDPIVLAISMVSTGCCTVLGGIGLVFLRHHRRATSAASPLVGNAQFRG